MRDSCYRLDILEYVNYDSNNKKLLYLVEDYAYKVGCKKIRFQTIKSNIEKKQFLLLKLLSFHFSCLLCHIVLLVDSVSHHILNIRAKHSINIVHNYISLIPIVANFYKPLSTNLFVYILLYILAAFINHRHFLLPHYLLRFCHRL